MDAFNRDLPFDRFTIDQLAGDLLRSARQARSVAIDLHVVEVAFARSMCVMRIPFRFGAVTLDQAEQLTCRITVRDVHGKEAVGWSADLLVPRWFRKDTDATPQEDANELFDSAVAAARHYVACTPSSAFRLWRQVFAERVNSQPQDQPDLLVRGYGVGVVERALLDACCLLVDMSFAVALQADVFGFRPGDVHDELADWRWQADLPEPNKSVVVRHTVGMLDVLREKELAPEDRLLDGLPQTLEQDIAAYGVSWFKVKVGAGIDADRSRLLDLAAFFAETNIAPKLTLDGNEQYDCIAELADLLEAVASHPLGRELLSYIDCIEQPLGRANTFDSSRHRGIERVTKFAPLMIDEADATPLSFQRALEIGYRGVSVKNCKGVFRALCNFGISKIDAGRFQSGEDLSNIGVLSLQQDLVTGAVLGLPHVERNGHHYFRGLDHLPDQLAKDALAAHPDIYHLLPSGVVAPQIVDGRIGIASAVAAVGYGHSGKDYAQSLQVVAAS